MNAGNYSIHESSVSFCKVNLIQTKAGHSQMSYSRAGWWFPVNAAKVPRAHQSNWLNRSSKTWFAHSLFGAWTFPWTYCCHDLSLSPSTSSCRFFPSFVDICLTVLFLKIARTIKWTQSITSEWQLFLHIDRKFVQQFKISVNLQNY